MSQFFLSAAVVFPVSGPSAEDAAAGFKAVRDALRAAGGLRNTSGKHFSMEIGPNSGGTRNFLATQRAMVLGVWRIDSKSGALPPGRRTKEHARVAAEGALRALQAECPNALGGVALQGSDGSRVVVLGCAGRRETVAVLPADVLHPPGSLDQVPIRLVLTGLSRAPMHLLTDAWPQARAARLSKTLTDADAPRATKPRL